jgi:hypothetical protein
MRFSCAPPERGGHTNKGNNHVLSIVSEPAAQHGQRPCAEWRQRQLQTLVRWRGLTDTPELLDPLKLLRFGFSRVI